jgi:two-component system invasion response regulator UvrY
MIRTLMAEANPVARLGIRAVLGVAADALEIDEACSQSELMARLGERYYEFIIVEPAMCGAGTTLVGRLHELSPWADILVFTALDELSFGIEAIRKGAKGYLMKTATGAELRTAVKRVAGGQFYLSKALAAEFATGMRRHDARYKPHERFSKREFQVFSLAVCGLTVVESAQLLHLSTEAVGDFKRSVMSRLQASTAQDLVEYALAQGLGADCRATCIGLWSGRFGQAAATPGAATHAASSAAGIGFAMR